MGLELAYEFSFRAVLEQPADFGVGPLGRRMYFEVTGGEATGDRFNATLFGGGGDWVVLGPDGFGRIDVRLQFRTDDGALVYAQYLGILEPNATVTAALAAGDGETGYEDQYFRTAPRFETGDERYAWMNQSLFVARGHVVRGPGVEYEVYRVS